MYRFFFRFAITSLTILTANLLTNAISNYMVSYKNSYKPLTFTLLGMAVIVTIFYPLFMKLEGWITTISIKAINKGNSLAGRNLGLIITFSLGLFVLMYFYAAQWFHINVFSLLFHGNILKYF